MFLKIEMILSILFLSSILTKVLGNFTTSSSLIEDSEDDWSDEEDEGTSGEVDDESNRVYKNPRNSPSTLCPRDEEQATLLGQKCLRKCSSDEDCKSKKKKCLCDGACGMSCIKPDRECPEPVTIQFGVVIVSGHLFGARASYSCEHGYHVVGLQSRTCQGDGQWAGQAPACKQNIYCLSPPTIDHARHNALSEQSTFDLDSTLQYFCHTGYVTNGFPRAKCLAIDGQASWYGPDISCEPRSCGTPAELSHGWHAGECYTFGCRLTYHCAEGYELVGKSERQCQSDGTWTPRDLPTCVLVTAVQCSPPENPRHGKAIYTSCSYNSVVRYECNYGYTLVGESTRRCGADRKWSGNQPVCKEINCGHPGRLWNGWLENIEGGTGLGASIIFRCHEGMFLEGNSSTVCQIDGKWRYPLPRCLAPCVVPHILKGRVILLSRNDTAPTSTVVTHGEVLTVDCEPKYEFFSNYANVTCNNGTWTQMPKCEPARCRKLPKPPRHGMVSAPDMKHGMKAKFRCKDGYKPVGNIFMECSFGNWTGTLPRCTQVYCAYPGPLENGNILLVGNMGLYDYRPYVKKINNNKQIMYDCNKGYVLTVGAAGATCVGGKWSPIELPKCLPGEHPRFRFNRRRRSAIIKLKKKFPMKKEKLSTLYESMLYPKLNKNNIYKNLIDYNHGTKTSYYSPLSKKNKFINGGSTGLLNYFNIKNNSIIANRKKMLRLKRALKGSGAVGASVHKSSGSQKTSRRGHKPTKSEDDEDETPSTDNHQVAIKKIKTQNKTRGGPCDVLQDEPFVNIEIIKHGKYPNSTYSTGTIVRLACGKGYVLNIAENKTAKCVKGTWKPAKPECHIIPCYVPETQFGIYKLHKFENGSNVDLETVINSTSPVPNGYIVEFTCEEGYNVEGSTNMRCWHGEWAVTIFPECSPAPCLLPKILNGQYMSGYRPGLTIANGSSISFQCDEGYNPISVQLLLCSLGELYPKDLYCLKEGQAMPETHYMGGKDIVKGGDITVIEYGSSTGKPCGPPAKIRGSLIYKNGEQLIDDDNNFPEGSEVTFNCIESIVGEKTTWKIVCENGGWIGKSLTCEADEYMQHQTITNNSTCSFRNQEPNVISFYNDQKIKEEVIEFPTGAVLISRCIDIGKYAMIGPNKRRCLGGEWDGPKPVCFGLNQENDYSMEKPPTILFRHHLGPIAQSNDGKLIIYPGTTLHMECLWIRRFGIPKWTISHDYRKYPEGWTTDPGRDSQLEYRLSIIHATKDDSGLFTCVTPARYTHSVEIVVKAVHCPALPQRRGLKANTQNTKMNSHIKFYCVNGNSLIGATEITCLPSGNWSAPFPVCESVECGEVGPNLGARLKVLVVSREVGGRAVFSCDSGFSLKGPAETMCQASGDWAIPFPSCEEVYCDEPLPPINGYIQGNGPYKAGDIVQFNCNTDYMMEGQPIIACQDNSKWSGKIPKCVQACSYPGTTISGRMSNVKFYYTIGENITFSCEQGLRLKGAAIIICLKNGKWSNAIPTCISEDTLQEKS